MIIADVHICLALAECSDDRDHLRALPSNRFMTHFGKVQVSK